MTERRSNFVAVICLLLVGGISALTEQDIDAGVTQVLKDLNTDLNTVLSTVSGLTDTLWQTTINTVLNTPLAKSALASLNIKANNAKARPASFSCDPQYFKSDTPPTSAHKVRVNDIKIVGGIGDGIMAGLGTISTSPADATLFEGRGYCSKIGGTGSVFAGNTTISNILRDYFQNSDLRGYAVADGHCSQTNVACAHNDVADKLAFHPQFVLQAIELVRRIALTNDYNPLDWKMIHIFYGPNDLCNLCQKIHYSPTVMAGLDLRITIKILQYFFKNTILYLHVPYDLTPLGDIGDNVACKLIQTALCNCVTNPLNPLLQSALPKPVDYGTVRENQQAIAAIYDGFNTDPDLNSRDDFALTIIKHLTNSYPPKDPKTGKYIPEILSSNCLHPSRAAHYTHAMHVVNEMFTAQDQRPLSADYTINSPTPIVLNCPTATNPYLRTNKN